MTDTIVWSSDQGEQIERSALIVSTSSSSHSQSISTHAGKNSTQITPAQLYVNEELTSKSCDDLLKNAGKKKMPLSRSQSCISLISIHAPIKCKYEHAQSKIHRCKPFDDLKIKDPGKQVEPSKEEYLKEINNRLSRELEEKNAILQQLQENYEHLLLKYAEAQNKIDNLRLKSLNESKEQSGHESNGVKSFKKHILAPSVYPFKSGDICGLALTTSLGKLSDKESRIDRPSTLAVDSTLRFNDKEGLKAVTPTDSEGVSSVITSMSGHSKILTNLDEAPKENEKNLILKSEVLENVLPVNDPFDKVKNWQNSLPPLDMIETPDTALYDLDAIAPVTTPSTRYNDFPLPELTDIPETGGNRQKQGAKTVSQAVMKKYLRTLSLPSSLTRRNMMAQIYKRRNNHTIDLTSPIRVECFSSPENPQEDNNAFYQSPPSRKVYAVNIIQKRKRRPPFLRSSSLPIYDLETARSSIRNNVPPLDLDNLTLSEDDTSPVSKSVAVTSPSFLNSHDCSFQTLDSLNSCKATVSDLSLGSFIRPNQPIIHKSTSITPDRSKEMISCERIETSNGSSKDCCNVCGETVLTLKAASIQAIPMRSAESSPYMSKLPVHRSISFTSESSSAATFFQETAANHGIVDSFETYASNLKARSQVIMKALTAHVKNS